MKKRFLIAIFALSIAAVFASGCSEENVLDRIVSFHNLSFGVYDNMKEERINEDVWSFVEMDGQDTVLNSILAVHGEDYGESPENIVLEKEKIFIMKKVEGLKRDIDAYVAEPFVVSGREVAFTRYEITDTWDDGTVNKSTEGLCAIVGAGERYEFNVYGETLRIEDIIDSILFSQ